MDTLCKILLKITQKGIHMKKDITELFVFVDDFCKAVDEYINQKLLEDKTHKTPTRKTEISYSEMITIELLYQQSHCTNFKYFYNDVLLGASSEVSVACLSKKL